MASESNPLAPLLAALRDLTAWFRKEQIQGMVIGGVAASLLGRPRVTRDVDAMVLLDESRWQGFLQSGSRFGFEPRIHDAMTFAHQARILLLLHKPSGIEADIAFGALAFEEEAVGRAQAVDVKGVTVLVPAPADLIIMKAVAHRHRDLVDIEAVLDAHPRLNLRGVRRWVKDFASALETPEIIDDLESLLARRKHRRKRKGKP